MQRFDASRLDLCAYLEASIAAGDDEDAQMLRWRSSLRIADDVMALILFAESSGDRRGRPQRRNNARFATFLRASRYTKAQIAELTSDLLERASARIAREKWSVSPSAPSTLRCWASR